MLKYATDNDEITPYLTDESSAFAGRADRLYRPERTDEVAEILRSATESGTAVTTSGAGTSITGARVPTDGGWILATDRMRRSSNLLGSADEPGWEELTEGDARIQLNRERQLARVPAGIRLIELDEMLSTTTLVYPPDPTEMTAMLGGTIATNASGARSFHYGPTRDWVEALVAVTPTGRVLTLRRGQAVARPRTGRADRPGIAEFELDLGDGLVVSLPRTYSLTGVKNAAGYYIRPEMDAVDLFIGGEGTLAVITEAEVRLAPRPAGAVTVTVFTSQRDTALDIADAARDGRFNPATVLSVEYYDSHALDFIRARYPETPEAAGAVALELMTEGEHCVAPMFSVDQGSAAAWMSTLETFNPIDVWVTLSGEREEMRLFRHSLPEQVNDYVRSRRGKLGTDMAVPADAFRDMMGAYDEAQAAGVRTVMFGHLGDHHLHLNFLAEDDGELARARKLYSVLASRAVALGGTVSAEHGVGKKGVQDSSGATVPYLELMVGADGLATLAGLKRSVDPEWVLNRNTMIPWSGSHE